jgi:Ca-activated chloride channel homolog
MSALPIVACPPSVDQPDAGFGCLRGPRGALPLTDFSADLAVVGPVWRWRLRQVFANRGKDPIEAVYIFPLPPRGAVGAFRMRVAGRLVEGDLQERGAAREVYQQAIQAGQRAALLEEDRPDVFTVQVGNIQAGESAEVEIELSGPIAVEDGIASLRLPLVVAPRYIPGATLGDDVGVGTANDTDAVPDASRISPPVLLPGFPNPVRLAISLAVSGIDADDLACSLPTVADGAGRWRVVPGQRLDRDCIVRWSARGAQLAARALVATGASDGGCTLALSIVPPLGDAAALRPRDVVVLLDRSGSMSGWKMVAARRAAARLVDALDARDRFAALAFDDSVEAHDQAVPALHAATDRIRFAATTWLGGIESRGGTELTGAMDGAFALLAGGDETRERILVLVTDAQIGDEDRLLKRHAKALARTRVVALGIDQAVNEGLLERLVAPNRGWHACVESEDWLDRVMALAARAVQPPSLADITVETPEGPLPACTPEPAPDAWSSRPLTLWARLPAMPASVTVRGTRPDGSAWQTQVAVSRLDESTLHATWARGRIRDLEDRHAVAASGELASEIVRVSLAERVLSRFTAFVAVDRIVAGEGRPRTIVQAVEQPAGWETLADSCAAAPCAPPPSPAPDKAKKLSEPGGSGIAAALGGSLRRSVRRAVPQASGAACREECDDRAAPPLPPGNPAELARVLHDRLVPLATDRLRIALALRAARTGNDLHELLTALVGHADLQERLRVLIARIARPASIDTVAETAPDLLALLKEAAVLPPVTPADSPRKRGRFWG